MLPMYATTTALSTYEYLQYKNMIKDFIVRFFFAEKLICTCQLDNKHTRIARKNEIELKMKMFRNVEQL